MCFTDNDELDESMRSLRVHGQGGNKYENVRIGINGRLDTLQAAILLAKFEIFPEEISLRQEAAQYYSRYFETSDRIQAPQIPSDCISAWAQYSVLAPGQVPQDQSCRDRTERGRTFRTAVYYPKPLHLQDSV